MAQTAPTAFVTILSNVAVNISFAVFRNHVNGAGKIFQLCSIMYLGINKASSPFSYFIDKTKFTTMSADIYGKIAGFIDKSIFFVVKF